MLLSAVLDEDHSETIDAQVTINDVAIYEEEEGIQLFSTTLFSEALDEKLQGQPITKIEIQDIATSSGAVWNEMINEIAARIDPETGL